mmetsp:Transcript_49476/g.74645  ORF Transcript_49476/g.74645 Transcript_49476/m.74645 type:complete len:88 (+) Transcript_49476:35-298(+)
MTKDGSILAYGAVMTLCYDGRQDASTLNRLLLIDEREVPALNGDEKDVPKDSILRPRNQQLTCCLRVPQKFFIPKSTVRSWERLMRE